jgi:hypothetical protein
MQLYVKNVSVTCDRSMVFARYAGYLHHSPGMPVTPTNKADRHDITAMFMTVAFKTPLL